MQIILFKPPQGELEFVMKVSDVDASSSEHCTIDTLTLDLSGLSVGDDFTVPTTYKSYVQFFRVSLSFRVVCAGNYYAPYCNESSESLLGGINLNICACDAVAFCHSVRTI